MGLYHLSKAVLELHASSQPEESVVYSIQLDGKKHDVVAAQQP